MNDVALKCNHDRLTIVCGSICLKGDMKSFNSNFFNSHNRFEIDLNNDKQYRYLSTGLYLNNFKRVSYVSLLF